MSDRCPLGYLLVYGGIFLDSQWQLNLLSVAQTHPKYYIYPYHLQDKKDQINSNQEKVGTSIFQSLGVAKIQT